MAAGKKRKRKKWIIWLVLAILLGTLLVVGRIWLRNRQQNTLLVNIHTVTVSTGTIEKTVTGTGSLSAEDTIEEIMILDGLRIDQVTVEKGDDISAGDVLATLDRDVLQTDIWDIQHELDSLDAQLNRLKEETETQYIRTAVSGRVKQIFTSEGDLVQAVMLEHGALIMLSIDGKMKVEFVPVTTGSLEAGDTITVTLSDGTETDGTVQSVSDSMCVVTLSDRSAPVDDPVTLATADGTPVGTGILAINAPLAITSTGGTVGSVLCKLNDKVSSNAKLIKLDEAPVSQSYIKIYNKRLETAARLAALLDYAQENALTASCSGEVLSISIAGGQDTGVNTALSGQDTSSGMMSLSYGTALTVRTASNIQLTVDIDELDIAVLAEGQTAEIKLDALAGLSLAGTLVDISDTGMISQGGTTFKVTIEVPETDDIRLGMSATAIITIERREDIIRIPLEALQEIGNEQYVYVGTAVSADDLGEKRLITTGISDGEYVEVTSGLSAGEKINYYYVSDEDSMFPFARNRNMFSPQAEYPVNIWVWAL